MKKLLLTKKDVCFLLGVSPATIDRYRTKEEYAHLDFPKPENMGSKVFWRPEWIEAFVDKRVPKRD